MRKSQQVKHVITFKWYKYGDNIKPNIVNVIKLTDLELMIIHINYFIPCSLEYCFQ